MQQYEGRLELTWTNKHLRLLAHEDGSYEWLQPSDYRVAEVRLLHDVTSVGTVGKQRAADNLLIRGDALHALTSLAKLPEFAKEYLGKVKLAYLDPPFNTQQSFLHYDDALEHSVWLTMMRDRLLQIKELLSPVGSVWVHLDDSENAYCRVLMDELFGRDNFVATVVWEKADTLKMDTLNFSSRHDTILVYGATSKFKVKRTERTERPKHYNKQDETGRWYCIIPLKATGHDATRAARPSMFFPLISPDGDEVYPIREDGSEGRWAWTRAKVENEPKRIEWVKGKAGWNPYYRIYEDTGTGLPPDTIWRHTEVGNRTSNREIKKLFPNQTAFATPKPEALLARIIALASDENDIILDCFVGSGTTAAVAQKMHRRWVGIEREAATIESFALPRLKRVVDGNEKGGVTEAAGWESGGGFRLLEVSPSMFEADNGLVFLADWMTNGALAEATAAQLGFEWQPEPPFAGRKGRSRLAIVDGVVNEAVVRLILSALPERERVVICGTGIDTDARPILRELRPGSTLRKIPAALLDEYRSARQLRLAISDPELGASPDGQASSVEAKA